MNERGFEARQYGVLSGFEGATVGERVPLWRTLSACCVDTHVDISLTAWSAPRSCGATVSES